MVTQAIERGRALGGVAADRAAKLQATLQTPEEVARLIAALCLDAAAAITGQVFLIASGRVGLFRPLGVDQEVTIAAPTIEAVSRALRDLRLHPLDAPY
jgi:hypothetical protein